MQYMISPMDLTERQLLIYNVLYRRCNFKNMEISMTIDSIANSIRIANLSYSMVYKDIKEMEKKGYIKLIKKASKGTAPIYKLIKIIEYQNKTKEYQNFTNSKDKDKDNNIYSRIIDYLNEKASKGFKYTTKKTKSCIDARLKEGFTESDFLKVIDIKVKEWKDNKDMNLYLRPQTLFGPKFESYLQQDIQQEQAEQHKKYDKHGYELY